MTTFRVPAVVLIFLLAFWNGAVVSLTFGFQIRAFEVARDQAPLELICRNVFGGTDYLPTMAPKYAADPSCWFMVLASKQNDTPIAVANLRVFEESKSFWLEGVRVSEEHRNKGIAQELVSSMVELARHEGLERILTCTIQSNQAMRRIFDKIGMEFVTELDATSFQQLQKLPGWSAKDLASPKSLLSAMGIEHLVSKDAQEQKWWLVNSVSEMNDVLDRIKKHGGCGYFPGLFELLSPKGPLETSLNEGRVWACGDAIFALVRDERIASLKSNWLLSVSTITEIGLQAAIWRACSEEGILLLDGHVGFSVAFDCTDPTDGKFCSALKLSEDKALLYELEFNASDF